MGTTTQSEDSVDRPEHDKLVPKQGRSQERRISNAQEEVKVKSQNEADVT